MDLLATCRERRLIRYFRRITKGQQDAVELILARLTGQEAASSASPHPLPENVLAFHRKAQ